MKILHAFHHYKPYRGGTETVIEELSKALKKQGHECKVICLNKSPGSKQKLKASESFTEAEVERISFIDLKHYKLAPFRLSKLQDFDLVHVHGLGFFADYLALTKPLHKIPLVLSTHGGIFHTKQLSPIKKIYFSKLAKQTLKAFSKIIAVSKNDKKLFLQIADKKKITLIENGIGERFFSKSKRKRKKNFFLYFGRLAKNKGLFDLLNAFAVFKTKTGKGKLIIAGQDVEGISQDLKKIAKILDVEKNVAILGEISDSELQKLLSETEFFVSASKYEGFGITALEAMAAGLIPILNNIESFKEFVRESQAGFVVNFSNIEKTVLKMKKASNLRESEKEKIKQNAKSYALKFGWDKKAKEYVKIYKEAWGRNEK